MATWKLKNDLARMDSFFAFITKESRKKRNGHIVDNYGQLVTCKDYDDIIHYMNVLCGNCELARGKSIKEPTKKEVEEVFNLYRNLARFRINKIESMRASEQDKKELRELRRVEDFADHYIIRWYDDDKFTDDLPPILNRKYYNEMIGK